MKRIAHGHHGRTVGVGVRWGGDLPIEEDLGQLEELLAHFDAGGAKVGFYHPYATAQVPGGFMPPP